MSLLKFETPNTRKGPKRLSVSIILIFLLTPILMMVKTALAGNISINSGVSVTFGQGVAATVACDPEITLSPKSSFKTIDGRSGFKFTSITVSDISNNCFGTDFIIKAIKNGAGEPLNIVNSDGTSFNSIRINDNSGQFSPIGDSLSGANVITNSQSSFTVNFDVSDAPQISPLADSADVDRITIENVKGSSTISGSLAFNYNWIDYQANNAFVLGVHDFTIESWAKIDASTEKGSLYDTGGDVNIAGGLAFWFENDGPVKKLKYRMGGIHGDGQPDIGVEMNPSWYGSWHHYALTRTGGIMRMYVDGILVASSYDTVGNHAGGLQIYLDRNAPTIGALANPGYRGSYHTIGLIHSLRVIKGAALYTAASFTPPANLIKIPNTLLLVTPFSNGSFADQSDNHWPIADTTVAPSWVPDQPT